MLTSSQHRTSNTKARKAENKDISHSQSSKQREKQKQGKRGENKSKEKGKRNFQKCNKANPHLSHHVTTSPIGSYEINVKATKEGMKGNPRSRYKCHSVNQGPHLMTLAFKDFFPSKLYK